jgi:hypothetical protein
MTFPIREQVCVQYPGLIRVLVRCLDVAWSLGFLPPVRGMTLADWTGSARLRTQAEADLLPNSYLCLRGWEIIGTKMIQESAWEVGVKDGQGFVDGQGRLVFIEVGSQVEPFSPSVDLGGEPAVTGANPFVSRRVSPSGRVRKSEHSLPLRFQCQRR